MEETPQSDNLDDGQDALAAELKAKLPAPDDYLPAQLAELQSRVDDMEEEIERLQSMPDEDEGQAVDSLFTPTDDQPVFSGDGVETMSLDGFSGAVADDREEQVAQDSEPEIFWCKIQTVPGAGSNLVSVKDSDALGAETGDAFYIFAQPPVDEAATVSVAVGDVLPYWYFGEEIRGAVISDEIEWGWGLLVALRAPAFPVLVTKDAGASGGPAAECSWTYTVKDLGDSIVLRKNVAGDAATGMTPETPRLHYVAYWYAGETRTTPSMTMSRYGLACRASNGDLKLLVCYGEFAKEGPCP